MPFKILQYIYPQTRNCLTKDINDQMQERIWSSIVEKHRHVGKDYLINCFSRYSNACITSSRGQISGIFFYHFFSQKTNGYLYFGPTFFVDRKSFAMGTTSVLFPLLRSHTRVYCLAEMQNPELLIHIHAILEKYLSPKPFSFHFDNSAQEIIKLFKDHTPQIENLCIENFRSYCTRTLYRQSAKNELIIKWLKRNDIYLENGDALLTLIDLTLWRLVSIIPKIIYAFLTYPRHKTNYLTKLKIALEAEEHADL